MTQLTKLLRDIDLKLTLHGKFNVQVNLPPVVDPKTEYQRMKLAFNQEECATYADTHLPNPTTEQRQMYDTVLKSVTSKQGRPR